MHAPSLHGSASRRFPLPTVRLPALPRPGADWQVAIGVVVFLLLFDNLRFWRLSVAELGLGPAGTWSFALSLLCALLYLHLLPLLLMPGRVAMRVAATVMLVIGAAASHFVDQFGSPMNGEMMQNLLQTDASESAELLSPDLLLRLALLGVLPAVLLWRLPWPIERVGQRWKRHAVILVAGLVVTIAAVMPSAQTWAVFLREHRPLRSFLNPGAVLVNLPKALFAAEGPAGPLLQPGAPLQAAEASVRPRVVVLVIGETARAANFGLGGYSRQTTPRLAARDDVVYFPDVEACGTSTAVSVLCLFSASGHAGLRGNAASRYLNLLDLLQASGVDVIWADNNSGCKGVCARVRTLQFSGAATAGPQCVHAHCFDSVLLEPVRATLSAAAQAAAAPGAADRLVVLHQIGSHGPAYHERIPADAAVFQPACRTVRLDECSREEIVNAYDNTIHYTDSVLADLIGLLADPRWKGLDTALLYVSDHGESLGEQGLFLHGMPEAIAPAVQSHVPMLLWLSPAMLAARAVESACLRRRAEEPASHDDVFPTVLGLLGRGGSGYRVDRDRVGVCSATRPS